MEAPQVPLPLAADITIMSKTMYESELQWGRLVIPGKYVDHFRQLQEENNLRGDYHLWCVDAVSGENYQIGVKMSIQRPMLIELHPLYRGNSVMPGDTVIITRSGGTGQRLVVRVAKGQGLASTAGSRRSGVDTPFDNSGPFAAVSSLQPFVAARPLKVGTTKRSRGHSLDLDDLDTPSAGSLSSGSWDAQQLRRSRRTTAGSRRGSRSSVELSDEDVDPGDEAAYSSGDGELHTYRTSSGRLTTKWVRPGTYSEGGIHGPSGLRRSGTDSAGQYAAAIDAHQPLGYSEDMELDYSSADMARFDALVAAAADCMCA